MITGWWVIFKEHVSVFDLEIIWVFDIGDDNVIPHFFVCECGFVCEDGGSSRLYTAFEHELVFAIAAAACIDCEHDAVYAEIFGYVEAADDVQRVLVGRIRVIYTHV